MSSHSREVRLYIVSRMSTTHGSTITCLSCSKNHWIMPSDLFHSPLFLILTPQGRGVSYETQPSEPSRAKTDEYIAIVVEDGPSSSISRPGMAGLPLLITHLLTTRAEGGSHFASSRISTARTAEGRDRCGSGCALRDRDGYCGQLAVLRGYVGC